MEGITLWGPWALGCLGSSILAGLALAIWRFVFKPIHSHFDKLKRQYTEYPRYQSFDDLSVPHVRPAGQLFGCIAGIFWLLAGLFRVLAVCLVILAGGLFVHTIVMIVRAEQTQLLVYGVLIVAAVAVVAIAVITLKWIVGVFKDLRSGPKRH